MKTVIYIFATALLLVLILIKNFFDTRKESYRAALIIAIVSLIFHFYVYSTLGDSTTISLFVSSVRSASATLKLFGGYTLISDPDFLKVFNQNAPYAMLLYYVLHILAFAMTLSALVLTIGKRYIYNVYKSLLLLRSSDNYYVFYKYNDRTADLVDKLLKMRKNDRVVILDDKIYEHIENAFNDLVWERHCIILSEDINEKTISSLFVDTKYENSNIKLIIVNDDIDENYQFAKSVFDKISTYKKHNSISLNILSDDYYDFKNMQGDNCFDYVRSFNDKDMLARVLVKEYPPCNYVEFENCRAKNGESFNCLIIGFGERGQRVFKRLLTYGQFVNCKFNCDIIDEELDNVCAEFESEFDFLLDKNISKKYKYITSNIKIERHNFSARGKKFYEYINTRLRKLDYIVVSTSSSKTNNEIVKNLLYMRKKLGDVRFDVFDCLEDRIYAYKMGDERKEIKVYDHILDDKIDRLGKLTNYIYGKEMDSHGIESLDVHDDNIKFDINAEWKKCNPHNKNSSISAAEFYETILTVIGKNNATKDYKSIIKHVNGLSNKVKDDLGKLEHNRWSIFELIEGWRYVEYDKTVDGKDKDKKLHSCLIPYEELPKLDKKVERLTGKKQVYSENDKKNVVTALLIAELMETSK